jgi:hypothetical protein
MAMHLNDRMFETHLSTPASVRHSLSLQVTAILQHVAAPCWLVAASARGTKCRRCCCPSTTSN